MIDKNENLYIFQMLLPNYREKQLEQSEKIFYKSTKPSMTKN